MNIKLSYSMNGSNVWSSLAPYGDALPWFKWNIYKRRSIFLFKTVIIDDSLQITLGSHPRRIDFITYTAIILNFIKLVIFF